MDCRDFRNFLQPVRFVKEGENNLPIYLQNNTHIKKAQAAQELIGTLICQVKKIKTDLNMSGKQHLGVFSPLCYRAEMPYHDCISDKDDKTCENNPSHHSTG